MKDEKEAILDGSMDRSSGCPPNRYVYAEEVQLMSVISLLTYIWILFFPLLPLLLLLFLPLGWILGRCVYQFAGRH